MKRDFPHPKECAINHSCIFIQKQGAWRGSKSGRSSGRLEFLFLIAIGCYSKLASVLLDFWSELWFFP